MQRGLTLEIALEVRTEKLEHLLRPARDPASHVRCQNEVWRLPQIAGGGQGFDFTNIQPGAGELPGFKRMGEGVLVDDATTGDVDEVG